ncbi:MAG: undecaprenyl/decaprenyl-phosphate alpha-N-acetylglucosaminyl 1-phosphate transferase [Flavobacteriales bacterium]|jgi:UDP-GlcNAc:undecaprenyl-phosphate GlcNAc-1-phosphate transferase|nr:undecaprenyl/decaprenyl-phosphate alpha-N-acetylglucosaminyl 1-phosphate transferase [Flavobacteriales bacterium]MBK6550918.1 undecaprenyl/decaprenyl-phosphate alpha-N-acetylglucosaminyl 1-phosphate transferase [Flavobacteriales bacterium]MBK6882476.1 undecaprenyl/decaprenyl-phosphate alpha-N-acetylglucosaminyl 1-phosphate transferase [Flavobacteriales bacterium]MBK7101314.1 undecaprenyl/decaprenyl-phosphate alpha-N-acetylglucosaminyl 1-phosphate transferase [Flavobacteriales bacterium]MBK71
MYSPTQLFLIYSGLFFAALVFSLLINSVFMRFARTLGMREEDQNLVRWSSTAKPSFGGICFYILFLASFSLYGVIFPGLSVDALRPDLLGLLAATSLGFLMGLADDAYNTNPVLKFLAQVACGGILIASGSCIDLFDSQWANVALTLFWVVGMMNSINMLDNMDGITTSVSIAVLIAGLMSMLVIGPVDPVYMVLLVGTMAALTGFLFFNWNPSRMYMGDTGSQFLGVFLAFVGIRFFWNAPSIEGHWEPIRQVISAITLFLLPIVDTTVVTITRIRRGRSPFVGGRDHTTHHLSYAGFSDGQVALVFIGLSLLHVFLTFVMARYIPVWQNIHTTIFVSYAILLFLTLFILTRRTHAPKP